jgi:hypothetical protein
VGAHPDNRPIAAHIEAVSMRAEPDTVQLMSGLAGGCWPGGIRDRSEAVARQWLRRWRPSQGGGPLLACDCAAGRCMVCN